MIDPFATWVNELRARHFAELSFREVRRGLQALSTIYVQRRAAVVDRALDGAGKRAAFAFFYAPLHFLLVREVVRGLGAATPAPSRVTDLGCGTGVGAAAWAFECTGAPQIRGVDRNRWAIAEARWTLGTFGLRGKLHVGDLLRERLPGGSDGVIAAYTVNELAPEGRADLLPRLLEANGRGCRVLIIEPIAKTPLPWWTDWSSAFTQQGGRADTWELEVDLPQPLAELDHAAGLDHRCLKGRSLYLPAAPRT